MLFLDTRPLHALLMQNSRDARAEDQARKPLSDRTPKRSRAARPARRKLASQVDPEFKPFARRGERTAAGGHRRCDRRLREDRGLPARGGARSRSSRPTPARASAARWSSRCSGAMRNEADRRVELARRRLAQYAAPGGPWEVKDVSPDRLPAARADERRERGHARHAGGDPAARPDGWTLGIVRRMKRLTADRAEIGLQVIASDARRRRPGRAAQSADDRLFGRRRGGDDQRPQLRRAVPRAAQARRRRGRAIADRARRRVPAGQAAEAASRRRAIIRDPCSGGCSSSSPTGCGRPSSRGDHAQPIAVGRLDHWRRGSHALRRAAANE